MKTFYKVNAIIAAVGFLLLIVGGILFCSNWNSFSANTVSYEETIDASEMKDVDTLKIDTGFASLKVVRGDSLKLVANEVPELFKAKLSSDGNVVSMKSQNMKYNARDIMKDKNMNISYNFSDTEGVYTLYIPENIKYLDVDFAFGSLNVNGIKAENANVKVAFSDSNFNFDISNELNIETRFGDTDVGNLGGECSDFSLVSSFGDCDIENICITNSAYIENSFGNLDVELIGENYDVDTSTAFGSTDIDGDTSNGEVKVKVANSFGDTSVSANTLSRKFLED